MSFATLEQLRANFRLVTGSNFEHFFCPILHEDSLGPRGLMRAHVVPDKIKSGSGACVPQRKDVDEHFATTVEPELIEFANQPWQSLQERVANGVQYTIAHADGRTWEAFPVGRKQARSETNPSAVISAVDDAGKRFLDLQVCGDRDEIEAAWESGKLRIVSDRRRSSPGSVVAKLLHSAYLAQFREFGYAAAFGPHAEIICEPLASFVRQREAREDAAVRFAKFHTAIRFVSLSTTHAAETPTDGLILVHRLLDGLEFALSLLLRMNQAIILVALPFGTSRFPARDSIAAYETFLADPSTNHTIHRAGCRNGVLSIYESATPLRHSDAVDWGDFHWAHLLQRDGENIRS